VACYTPSYLIIPNGLSYLIWGGGGNHGSNARLSRATVMWALRPQLYGPNVVNIGLPPKQHHAIAAASAPVQPPRAAPVVRFPRERILLGRWRRRARQRLLPTPQLRMQAFFTIHSKAVGHAS